MSMTVNAGFSMAALDTDAVTSVEELVATAVTSHKQPRPPKFSGIQLAGQSASLAYSTTRNLTLFVVLACGRWDHVVHPYYTTVTIQIAHLWSARASVLLSLLESLSLSLSLSLSP